MLPNLAGLKGPPAAPVGVVLDEWAELEERLTRTQLRRVPETLRERDAECAICQERLSDSVGEGPDSDKVIVAVDDPVLSCGHAFHLECALRWFDRQRDQGERALRCPTCSEPFVDAFTDARYGMVRGERGPRPRSDGLDRARRLDEPEAEPQPGEYVGRLREGWFYDLEDNTAETYDWHMPLFYLSTIPYGISVPAEVQEDEEDEYLYGHFRQVVGPEHAPSWETWQQTMRMPQGPRRAGRFFRWTVSSWASDASAAARGSFGRLVQDLREARAEGSTWVEIFSALVMGDEPTR